MKWITLKSRNVEIKKTRNDRSYISYYVVISPDSEADPGITRLSVQVPFQSAWLMPITKESLDVLLALGGRPFYTSEENVFVPSKFMRQAVIDLPMNAFVDKGIAYEALRFGAKKGVIKPLSFAGRSFYVEKGGVDGARGFLLAPYDGKTRTTNKTVRDETGQAYKIGREFEFRNTFQLQSAVDLDEAKRLLASFVSSNASFGYSALGLLAGDSITGVWLRKGDVYFLGYECGGERSKKAILFHDGRNMSSFSHVDLPEGCDEIERFNLDMTPAYQFNF